MVKYIFCVNPGRTGSEYVSTLFSCVDNVASFHEPKPILHGSEMRKYLSGDPTEMNNLIDSKLKFIEESLKNKSCYVETNHCFIKGFGWLLPGRLPENEIGVVILKRNRQPVVDSLYKVNAHPFSTTGEKWIITPQHYQNNITPYPAGYSRISFLLHWISYRFFNKLRKIAGTGIPDSTVAYAKDLIGWYVDETYALGEKFSRRFPGVKVAELDVTELNTVEGFEKLLSTFNIPPKYSQDVNNIVGKKVNERGNAIKVK